MVNYNDIEQRVHEFVRGRDGVPLFKCKESVKYNHDTDLDIDLRFDENEAEELMEECFKVFNADRGNFNLKKYYAEPPFSWNPFKNRKAAPILVPPFTIGMLIESAKVGRWLYD